MNDDYHIYGFINLSPLKNIATVLIRENSPTNKVRNKETTEQMHSRNAGTGKASNLELPDERPTP